MNSILSQILVSGEGDKFYRFANADGKQWIMPARHMRTAMNLYQPSNWKGLLVKAGLPYLHSLEPTRRFLHTRPERCRLSDELRDLLNRTFGKGDWEFSVFCGTPCIHQKITLQISRNKRIAGYVKVTDNEDIFQVFEHENRVLASLHRQGINDVPECLHCGTLSGGLYVFVQTTVKTAQSKVLHHWGGLHRRFLEDLAVRTRRQIAFEDSDYCRDLELLERCLPLLAEADTIRTVIERVRGRYAGKTVAFSAFHADFTPWNMFEEKGRLFVFDWEYARMTYPPMLDFFHFMIQTAVFEDHLTAEQIGERYRQQRAQIQTFVDDPDGSLTCYLLAIISLYVSREQPSLSPKTQEQIGFWTGLLLSIDS